MHACALVRQRFICRKLVFGMLPRCLRPLYLSQTGFRHVAEMLVAVLLDEINGVGETRLLHAMLLLPETSVDDGGGQIIHSLPLHDEVEDDCGGEKEGERE